MPVFGVVQHSTLYHLEPIGMGSAEVESLTSYIMRLALAHRISTYDLVDFLYGYKRKKVFIRKDIRTINGVGKNAMICAERLEKLTLRTDIKSLTMLFWSDLIDPQGKWILSNKRRWCPLCFDEQKKSGGIVYEKLIWSLSISNTCHIHNVPLDEQCPKCLRTQNAMSRNTALGFCSNCGEELSLTESSSLNSDGNCQWRDWVNQELPNWLNTQSNDLISCDHKEMTNIIYDIVNKLSKGSIRKVSIACQFSETTLKNWINKRYRPSFNYLFYFCYHLNIKPVHLLSGDVNSINSFAKLPCRNAAHPPNPRKRRNAHDHNYIAQKLDHILNSEELISLKQVAKRLNVSTGYLHHRFPKEYAEICSRYLKSRKKIAIKNIENKKKIVKKTVYSLHKSGQYPSRSKVLKACTLSVFRKPEILQAWREALSEMGYTSYPPN